MELIKTVVIIINSFMLIFYMVYINSKAPYKKAIGNLFYYLKTCSEKDFEKFIEDITELRNETEKNDSTTIM
ncbi:MAG: hypothetical protein J6S67_24950 [Methanobrevibacter sp.]|nr:hypothetical protein [Methanobrevibacter sp.]